MEAFEKLFGDHNWYEYSLDMRINHDGTTKQKEEVQKVIARYWFRAALEWTLRTAKELDEQDAPICMQEVIESELEN